MVVLSAAICTKGGKALLARQFVELTRIRTEGLLAAFPKLMGTDNKQHTFVETESVRYVYLPLDTMYLLLVTNRASNIVEDLETLRLLSKVIPSVTGATGSISEDKLLEKSFDILFAFDEVITAGGYREAINLQQIKTNMEMESHEEKLHNMIKLSKMESAKDQAAAAAKSIKDKQKELARLGLANQSLSSQSSVSSGGLEFSATSSSSSSSSSSTFTPSAVSAPTTSVERDRQVNKPHPVKGMSLTAAAKSKAFEDALIKEDKISAIVATSKTSASESSSVAAVASAPAVQHPLMLQVAEKVSAKLSRDGSVEQFDVKGQLILTALNDDVANCVLKLKQDKAANFTFTTHPKMNKALYEKSQVLQLKDAGKGFPSGRPVGILKWSYVTNSSDELVPIKINCWPEEEKRGQMNVSIEYSVDLTGVELHEVRIVIPLGTSDALSIVSIDGTYRHNPTASELIWEIPLIDDSNTSGSLEFNIAQRNSDAFFPINVSFSSKSMYCNLDLLEATAVSNNSPIIYGLTKSMSSEEYIIG